MHNKKFKLLFVIFGVILSCILLSYSCSGKMDDTPGGSDGDTDTDSDTDTDTDSDTDTDTDSDTDTDTDSDSDSLGPDRDGDGIPANIDCDDRNPFVGDGCSSIDIGTSENSSNPWDPTPQNSSGVLVDDNGNLILDSSPSLDPYVWIANSDEGTISKLYAEPGPELGREVARYSTLGASPSRTAVDFRGDCWVANRAWSEGGQGSVTKIAGHLTDCIDKNGNGVIETSHDVDGNGRINIDDPREFLGANDECIIFNVNVGGRGGIPRAMAIAPDPRNVARGGNGWVGLNMERKVYVLAGEDGSILRVIDVPINPYGALAAKYLGVVWITNAGWQSNLPDNSPRVVSISINDYTVNGPFIIPASQFGCIGTYGITVDTEGRVWVGGYPCEGAFRFDPRNGSWMYVDTPGHGRSRGIVATQDGLIYLAHSWLTDDRTPVGVLSVFRAEDGGGLRRIDLGGLGTIGVDVDAFGNIWAVNQGTNNASWVNPQTGEVREFPVGRGPYTYSDFTGHALTLQFPQGYYRDVIESCNNAEWLGISWDGYNPQGSVIEIRVRVGNSEVELSNAQWYGPWNSTPINLLNTPQGGPVPQGKFLEIEITMRSEDGVNLPALEDIRVSYRCGVG